MTYEEFATEVARAENILSAMADFPMRRVPEVNLSVEACECAAQITGFDATTAKMLNRQFRDDAARVACEMAQKIAA